MQPLFRKEAIAHKQDVFLGDVLLVRPLSFSVLTLFYTSVAAALLMYLIIGEYTKKARVTGYIVSAQGVIKIHSQQVGSVVKLLVTEGQHVNRGDVLAVVSSERSGENGSAQGELAKQLLFRRASYLEQQQQVHRLYAEQQNSIQKQIVQLGMENDQLELEITLQTQRVQLATRAFERAQRLASDRFVSEAATEDSRTALIDQKNKVIEIKRQKMANDRVVQTLQSDAKSIIMKESTEHAQIRRAIAEIDVSRVESEVGREGFVIAPQSGMITSIQSSLGKQVAIGLPMMNLIPANSNLQADLYVPSRAIGFVAIGKSALLQYSAFPYQKFGTFKGRVVKVSRTAVPASELPYPVANSDVYYVVTVQPDQDYVQAYGRREAIQTGMQVDADLFLDKRTLIEWIFEPLYSISGRV